MATFTGQLNQNEVFSALFNMIISQEVVADNVSGLDLSLVSKAKVDGGLYGDTKLYYQTNALHSEEWTGDTLTPKLLQTHRPEAPHVQSFTMSTFRYIPLTIDYYLTKRAFSTEGAFSSFNSVMLGWLNETKRIIDMTTYNAFIGTHVPDEESENIVVAGVSATEPTTIDSAKIEALKIAQAVANLLTELKDVNTINDLGYIRALREDEIKIIWNSAFYNRITKVDLPTIFHKDGLVDKMNEDRLPAKYFGTINGADGTSTGKTRALFEIEIGGTKYFAGQLIGPGRAYSANTTYEEDDKVICKIIGGKLPPYMSAFTTETSFFNPLALNENHYLIWGSNAEELDHFYDRPFITLKTSA